MKHYRHIIVGIDFSHACRAALKTAVRIASVGGTPITAVHVMDPSLAVAIKAAHNFTDDELFRDMGERVSSFMSESDIGTAGVRLELGVGPPFEVLLAALRHHEADLLVLGSRGSEHGPNEVGTVASKCVRKAPADVLLIRTNATGPFQRILACVDLSETSAKAVSRGRVLAELDHAELDCLFVYQSAMAMSLDYGGFVPPLPVTDPSTQGAWTEEVDAFLQPLLRTSEGLSWQSHIVERLNIREAIIEHIKETSTDLVVLGTRGKSGLRTLFMGTTAEKVVTHAPCSILAVKPDGFELPSGGVMHLPPTPIPTS